MQVKKFEARTMKEALEMVKTQLGPDAIILSARDNNRSFGLVGEGSVEITAAVSEETLQKKKFAESRLGNQDREKFLKSPAREQKQFITKVVDKHVNKSQPQHPTTLRRYIDIAEEEINYPSTRGATPNIRASTGRSVESFQAPTQKHQAKIEPAPQIKSTVNSNESEIIRALKNEIESLKLVINQFQQMPQNFVVNHPGSEFGINFDLSYIFSKMTDAGVAPEITAEILTQAQSALPALKQKNKPMVEAWVARYVLGTTKVVVDPTMGKFHSFVGPAGSGKTSTLIKMASHLVVHEKKKVALLTTDTHKVGAVDQMKIYAQILNVPFSVVRNQNDWLHLMKYFSSVDCVLIDSTGLSLRNNEEVQMMRNLLPPQSMNATTHLVLSANSKDSDVTEMGRRYSILNYKDVIFTGLDESTQHGTIYNFIKRFDIPVHSFGIGTRVPEDFEFATKERLLDLIFKITRLKQQELQSL